MHGDCDYLLNGRLLLGKGGVWIEVQDSSERNPYQLVTIARNRFFKCL